MRYCVCLIGLLLVLLAPASSFAELKMLVTPNGDGAFFLVGDNFNGVTAVDIRIDYDTASLANPQVGVQGGTLTYEYAGTPGTLLVSVFRENPDAMLYLDLKFEKRGASPGVIKQVKATTTDAEGKSSAVPDATIIPFSPSPESTPAAESGSEAGAVVSAGDSIETRQEGGIYQNRPDGTPDTGAEIDTASSARRAAQSGVPGGRPASPLRCEKSVLRRFEEFRGTKGLKEFTALFERHDQEEIAQEPAIALSDGKTPVRIKLKFPPGMRHAPDIALSDAKLVSMRKTGEKSWIITAVPNKGTGKVKLIVSTGRETIEFPLIVAPPIKIQNGINEKNFLVALNKYVADQAAGQKKENDPFRQYFCEYVFTANYLANPANTSTKMVR